jgi:hypothetical protein
LGKPSLASRFSRIFAQVDTCVGVTTLGSVTMKFCGSLPPVSSARRVRKMSRVRIERTLHSSEKVLMRMPMNGERMPSLHAFGDLVGRRHGMAIFLVVGPISVAVLEIDAVVLDRFGLQLLDDPVVDGEASQAAGLISRTCSGFGVQRTRQAVDFRRGWWAGSRSPAAPAHAAKTW